MLPRSCLPPKTSTMATTERRHRMRIAIIILAILSLLTGATTDEEHTHCITDPATGKEECEAVYVDNDNDEFDSELEDPEEDDDDWEEDESDWSPQCHDRHDFCTERAANNECITNPGFMTFQCAKSCNTCEEYMEAHQNAYVNGEWSPCTDNEVECRGWAVSGECAFNPGFMLEECRRSCFRCFVNT
jgi:hypothetical protein